MIEIEMPGDIKEFEAKVIGSLTLRQTICFGLAGALGFVGMHFTNNIYITMFLAIGPVMCGIFKPYDMGLEQFAFMIFLTYFLPPTNRKYIIKNDYDECIEKNEDEERQKILRSRKKKQQNRKSKNPEIIDYK